MADGSSVREQFDLGTKRIEALNNKDTILFRHAGFPKDYIEFNKFCERTRALARQNSCLCA